MSYLNIPEWEIEKAIVRNPSILGLEKYFQKPELYGEQFYLTMSGRFIDMLFMSKDKKYIIVELKKNYIDEPSVIFDQLLPYKEDLSLQLKTSKDIIHCVLATTRGFSSSVIELCRQEGIYCEQIDESLIFHFLSDKRKKEDRKNATFRLFRRRRPALQVSSYQIDSEYSDIEESIQHYINTGEHDENAKQEIAKLFTRMSAKAPLCAHEVFDKTYEKFLNESEQWFWLFYSVLDRRANAVTFVKASQYLNEAGLYDPQAICRQIRSKGKQHTIQLIRDILADSDFPLSSDSSRRDLAMPTSITEAALWYKEYEFSAENIRKSIEKRQPDRCKLVPELFEELKKRIYGVGDRIAGQIIRGFVLKGGWDWAVNIPSLLEKCDFNIMFASKPRLGLVRDDNSYYKDLQAFGDKYLEGNYCIISHVLWYIRKRYCLKPKRCFECPISGYCTYYYNSLYWQLPEHEMTLLDLMNVKSD